LEPVAGEDVPLDIVERALVLSDQRMRRTKSAVSVSIQRQLSEKLFRSHYRSGQWSRKREISGVTKD